MWGTSIGSSICLGPFQFSHWIKSHAIKTTSFRTDLQLLGAAAESKHASDQATCNMILGHLAPSKHHKKKKITTPQDPPRNSRPSITNFVDPRVPCMRSSQVRTPSFALPSFECARHSLWLAPQPATRDLHQKQKASTLWIQISVYIILQGVAYILPSFDPLQRFTQIFWSAPHFWSGTGYIVKKWLSGKRTVDWEMFLVSFQIQA